MSLLLLILGCAEPGHPWSEVVVDVSALDDPAEDLAAFEEGLAEFIDWTGRQTTQVEAVYLGQDPGDQWVGYYDAKRHEIRQEEGVSARVTTHELCHSLDHEEGWLSLDGAEALLPYTEDIPHGLYPTEDDRTQEAFAQLCEAGPAAPARQDALHRICDEDPLRDGERFVFEVAFPDFADGPEVSGRFSATTEVDTVAGSETEGDERGSYYRRLTTGREGLFVFDLSVGTTDGETWMEPTLLRVDPDAAVVLERLDLPAYLAGDGPIVHHALLGSTGDPILFAVAGEGAGEAWRVASDPLRLEPMAPLPFGEGSEPRGFERDGVLIARAAQGGPLLRIELPDGAPEVLGDGARFDPRTPTYPYVDERGALASFPAADGEGSVLVELSWSGEVTGVSPWPVEDAVQSLSRAPGGEPLVTLFLSGRTDRYDGSWATLLLSEGGWLAQREGCDSLGYGALPLGDELMSLSVANTDDGEVFELRRSLLSAP